MQLISLFCPCFYGESHQKLGLQLVRTELGSTVHHVLKASRVATAEGLVPGKGPGNLEDIIHYRPKC